jgi:hypothetical protein
MASVVNTEQHLAGRPFPALLDIVSDFEIERHGAFEIERHGAPGWITSGLS